MRRGLSAANIFLDFGGVLATISALSEGNTRVDLELSISNSDPKSFSLQQLPNQRLGMYFCSLLSLSMIDTDPKPFSLQFVTEVESQNMFQWVPTVESVIAKQA